MDQKNEKLKKVRFYYNIGILLVMAIIFIVKYIEFRPQLFVYTVPGFSAFIVSSWCLIPLVIGNIVFRILIKKNNK